MTPTRTLAAVASAGILALALAGCVAKTDAAASGALTVSSTDSACEVSTATATSGTLTFDVTNAGSDVSEFYLLADDGLRIVGEVENIAPGASRSLTVVAQPGDYYTLCKPGMVGEGVGKASFTVSGEKIAATGDDAEQKQKAVDLYAAFVKDQVEQLVPAVDAFTTAYAAGDDATARNLFPTTRAFYERIEPVAESLGDLDPRIDYREVDAVAEGLDWTGFHRIEKDLWVPAQDALNADGETPAWKDWQPSTPAERASYADQLVADVAELNTYVHSQDFTDALVAQGIGGISNGAIGLLDEVATGKDLPALADVAGWAREQSARHGISPRPPARRRLGASRLDIRQCVPEESVGDRGRVRSGRRRHLPDRVRVDAGDGVARFVDGCGGEQPHSGVDPLLGRVDPDLSRR